MSPLTSYIVETLVTLLAVVALAVLVLYGARRLGVGQPAGPVELVGRLPLDGRRAIYLVRVGATVYIVGASENGLQKLGEQSRDELDLRPQATSPPFARALSLALGRSPTRRASNPSSPPIPPEQEDHRADP